MKKVLLAALALCFLSSPVLAFHDLGVARCSGCHTMHNSQNGVLVDPDAPNGNPWLLNDGSPSDVCLNCHATSRGAVFTADPLNPPVTKGGGNFTFLLEDNLNDARYGAINPISGDAAGHNVHAPGHGLSADATLAHGPGGNFPASSMSCTSCHDPHGTDAFRMLYGAGRLVQNFYSFTNPSPDAVGLATGSAGGTESNSNHTAYRGGMSGWCGNCHGDFHNATTTMRHPSGRAMGATIAGIYNRYNGTTDQTGGVAATAYLASVPFEDPSNTTSSTAGPSATSQVSCISCHRAHASSAPDAGRWDFNIQFLADDGVESGSYAIPNPYPAAGANQKSLCNKCHNKDAFDHIVATP